MHFLVLFIYIIPPLAQRYTKGNKSRNILQACGWMYEDRLSFNSLLVPVNLVPELQSGRAKEDAGLRVAQETQTVPWNKTGT